MSSLPDGGASCTAMPQLALFAGALCVACAASPAPSGAPAPVSSVATMAPAPAGEPIVPAPPPAPPVPPATRFEAESLEELALEGFLPAVVAPPVGATTPQPVWVAAHGAGGKASVHCAQWRRMLPEGRGFVVCPRGFPTHPKAGVDAPGFYYVGHPRLAEEVTAALTALAARWPAWVDLEAPVFAGYSQGASMGALALPGHSGRFARVLLWEGGNGEHHEWNLRVARQLEREGTQRVLFACGRLVCREHADTSARYMRREGLEAEVIYVSGAGHTRGGELRAAVQSRLEWLLEGDHRWQ